MARVIFISVSRAKLQDENVVGNQKAGESAAFKTSTSDGAKKSDGMNHAD
jgi:hypothetical protein